MTATAHRSEMRDVRIAPFGLAGVRGQPESARGLVLFAHGSGSGRLSPRNHRVAAALRQARFGTLLFDLLTGSEAADRGKVFDTELLAGRLAAATRWAERQDDLAGLPVGYFGASTGAAAALVAAARAPAVLAAVVAAGGGGRQAGAQLGEGAGVAAVVSRGGRPDMAGQLLGEVRAPTLLIVGGRDSGVLELNRQAFERLQCPRRLDIVRGAGHLCEEPGALDQVILLARAWFLRHLSGRSSES